MADANLGGPLHGGLPAAPTAPALRRPLPQQPMAQNYPPMPPFHPYSPYDSAAFQARPHLPDPLGAHNPHVQNRDYYHAYGHPRPTSHLSPPSSAFPQHPNLMAHPQHTSWGQFPELPMPNDPHHGFPDHRGTNPFLLPMMHHPSSLHAPMHGYPAPSMPPFSAASLQDYSRRLGPSLGGSPVPSPGRFAVEPRPGWSNGQEHRPFAAPGRRTSYDRQQQNNGLAPGATADRRQPGFTNAPPPTRRQDRSVSPRTSSNRRSFDRYSTDLAQPSGNPDSPHRARRPRTIGFPSGYRARVLAGHDPNVPSTLQMQALKDKLRHFLPSELPEDASRACDICQKDYAGKHCLPTEDAEVAIQLPCKHVFGEHCINTWFETCKTHKNKITCPMCRKILVEPPRLGSHADLLRFNSLVDRHIFESLLHGEDRQLLESLAARELEGDFSSP